MQVSKIFHISVYLMLILSSLMMAQAEGASFTPQLLTPAIALVAFFLVDQQQKFALPGLAAGILGLIAFCVAVAEFWLGNEEARLLSGAHLIVYLSWIVVNQKKNNRQCWVLCSLSILQVAVGSVLTQDGLYGVELVLFVMLSMWTLSVFSLHQAQQRFSRTAQLGLKFATPQFPMRSLSNGSGLLLWNVHQPSQARGAVQQDPQERWISGRFIGGFVGTAFLALIMALLFFTLIPRYWIGQIQFRDKDLVPPGQALTGFTAEVQLGDIGQILESTDPVMNIQLYDNSTGERLDLERWASRAGYEEPLFRGTSLNTYRNRKWTSEENRNSQFSTGRRETYPSRGEPAVRQEIELQPIGTQLLFMMHPVIACRIDDEKGGDITYSYTSGKYLRTAVPATNKSVRYVVYSPQSPNKPITIAEPGEEPDRRYRRLPTSLDRIRDLALKVIEPKPGDPPLTERQKAERLESYLRDSGEFSYSLQMGVVDPNIDPVEDFLFNRKTGHCEYFASALALMLRGVGIPSRLVSGFKGGVFNPFSRTFEVQQRHAHAWVEAYIDRRWVPLDPTPADERIASLESMDERFNSWKDFQKFIRSFWSRNVVDLELKDQKKRFYTPIKEAFKQLWAMIKGENFQLGAIIKNVVSYLSSPGRWFSWRGGIATFVILLLLSAFYWIGKRIWRLAVWIYRELRNRNAHPQMSSIEFYERFRKICSARGWVRKPSQTQREFATGLTGSINAVLVPAGLGAFPEYLVELFYKVRFGNYELPERQLRELESQLTFLEKHWSGNSSLVPNSPHLTPNTQESE